MTLKNSHLKKSIYNKNEKVDNENNLSKKNSEKKNPLISIVIPIYNEEQSIKNVINRIPDHLHYEIILVDDGSTDNSIKKVKEINNRKIKIIQHNKNRGYGAAILSGFEHSIGKVIVTIDSDGQHNPEEIPALIAPIINNHADIVVGSRYLGKSNYKVPLYARVGEFFIKISLWLLYGQRVGNNQSGFKALSNHTIRIFNSMLYTRFGFCTEILFKAAHNNFKISEIPINLNPRLYGSSYVQLIKIMFSISSCILYYSMKRFRLNKFLRKTMFLRINFLLNKKFNRFKT